MALVNRLNQTAKRKSVKSNKQARTNMSAMVCNSSRAEWKYIRHLDSCDISDNSDSSESSDSHLRFEQAQPNILAWRTTMKAKTKLALPS